MMASLCVSESCQPKAPAKRISPRQVLLCPSCSMIFSIDLGRGVKGDQYPAKMADKIAG